MEKLTHLIKIPGFLSQTKVSYFGKNKSLRSSPRIGCYHLISVLFTKRNLTRSLNNNENPAEQNNTKRV